MEAEGQGQSDKKPTHCLVEEEFIIGVPLVGVVCLANGQGNIIVLVSLYIILAVSTSFWPDIPKKQKQISIGICSGFHQVGFDYFMQRSCYYQTKKIVR